MKQVKRRIMAFVMTFLVTVTSVFGNINLAMAEEMSTTYASWIYTGLPSDLTNLTNNGVWDTSTSGLLSFENVDTKSLIYSSNALTIKEFGLTNAILVSCSDISGADEIYFETKLRSSNTGAKNIKVQYRFDDVSEWTDTGVTWTLSTSLSQKKLTVANASGHSKIAFRLYPDNDESVNGKTIQSTGVTNINNIYICNGSNPQKMPTCAKPTISPNNTEVEKGTEISLSTTTEGATIYYNTDASDNFTEYKNPIVIEANTDITCYAMKAGYYNSAKATYAIKVKAEEEEVEVPAVETIGTKATTIEAGDVFVIYHEKSKMLLGTVASGSKLKGVEATAEDDKMTIPGEAAIIKAVENEDGSLSFLCDGKYLTSGATGSSLSFADSESEYSKWKVEDKAGALTIVNVNAKYGTSAQYIEYYSGYTTYSYKEKSKEVYTLVPYVIKKGVIEYKTDSTVTQTISSWGASTDYSTVDIATGIYGDLLTANDMKDKNSVYSVVKNGQKAAPYYTSATNSSLAYYMGGKGLGLNKGDYFMIETSSKGLAGLKLELSFYASNSGPGQFQGQYSTDGVNFTNLDKGTYAYSTTIYGNGTSTPVSKDGVITDGIAKTSLLPGKPIDFTFEIPSEAANADKLYIRFVADEKSNASGKSTPGSGGTVRFRKLELTGSPIVHKTVCSYAKANLASGGIPVGSELVLSSSTEGASIFYSINGGEYQAYTSALTLTELPVVVRTYATMDGMTQSAVVTYSFEQEKCDNAVISPNGGAILKSKKIKITTSTKNAIIKYAFVDSKDSVVEEDDWNIYTGELAITSFPQVLKAQVVKEGAISSAISTASFTEKSSEAYNIYFGQIHAHTNYSDGAGSCEEAFQYASKVDNLDYIAITDHSNSLDGAADASIDQGQEDQNYEWNTGHALAKQYSTSDFTCLYGYEMTWSNGLGHMNTFNTPGFQSRTQSAYATYSTALQNYYTALNKVTDSISMFNHPGTTFGDFSDFAYYSEANDSLINLIEVGNGEGVIGSSGYFPSYEYYTRALDKGWHVAPTNNQDNHKGKWGDANTARTVVLADANNEENIYDAMRNRRIYATEDNNLSIYYTLDGNVMGTILGEGETGENVAIKVVLSDASNEAIGKVEVIVNGGLSIASKNVSSSSETVTFNVPASYSYYYIKVTEKDGDIAVTAPVWIGEVEACGINGTSTSASLPIQGEDLDIELGLYNNEKSELVINSVEIEVDGTVVIKKTGEELGVSSLLSNSETKVKFNYVYNGVGAVEYKITLRASLNGVDKVYKDVLKVNYAAPQMVANVIIDGTHYNDYVTGYYGGNMNNFISMCGTKNVKAVIEKTKITDEMLKDCSLLVVSAPAKKTGTANAGNYTISHFEDEFLETVARYVRNGGSLVICGLADYSDSTACQSKTELDKLLAAVGSTIRINSDEVLDDVNNGGQSYRLYPTNYNQSSIYLAGVKEGQKYSQYSGCSIDITNAVENDYVNKAEALITGFDTTYSIDTKSDDGVTPVKGGNVVEKGNVVFLAHQTTKAGGNIFAAGGVFISDFEVSAEIDNPDSLPYINYTFAQNLISTLEVQLPVTNIADVRKAKLGEIFAIEGYVTNGTNNEFTTFFDSIYVQDATGGIDIFPYAESGLEIGTKIRIVGYVDEYQGDRELQVLSATVLQEPKKIILPLELSTKDAMNYSVYGGRLLKTTGIVSRVEYTSDGKGVSEFWIKDETGKEAAIFIDGYIYSALTGKNELASFVKVGAKVSAVGVLYMHPEGDSDESVPVFRVRNVDEITLVTVSQSGNASGNELVVPANNNQNTANNRPVGNEEQNSKPSGNANETENPTGQETEETVVEPGEDVNDSKEEQPSDSEKEPEKEAAKDETKNETKDEEQKEENGPSKAVVAVVVVVCVVLIGAGSIIFVRRRGKNA